MIKREVGLFLVVGVLTVLIDYLMYLYLLWWNFISEALAKGFGFIVGSIFAYFANRFWTFGHKQHALGRVWRFVLLYILTLMVNIGINTTFLNILREMPNAIHFAFLIATVTSATLNFVGMKMFVFTGHSSVNLQDSKVEFSRIVNKEILHENP